MGVDERNKLNLLLQKIKPGGLYFSAWLKENGYSDQLLKGYRDSGWLKALSRGVMYRTGDKLRTFAVLESWNRQLGSDKPILESLQPNPIDQRDALQGQFEGMTDVPFSYEDYEVTRKELIEKVNQLFTKEDKGFFVSFEQGEPE
jgi:hypothetical protein